MKSNFDVRRLKVGVALSALLILVACGGGASSDQETATPPPATAVVTNEGFPRPASARQIMRDGEPIIVADNQVVIVLVEDITPEQYQAVLDRLFSLGVRQTGTRIDMRMLVATTPGANGEAAVIAGLQTLPGVAHANYNFVVETQRANPPVSETRAAPFWETLLGRARPQAIAPEGRWWLNQIDLASAHAVEDELGRTTGPTIAIVDTGLPAGQTVLAESRVRRR